MDNYSRSKLYPTETTIDEDNADDLALHTTTPAQAESLLHSLEQAAWGIGLFVNADIIYFVYFNLHWLVSLRN